MSVDFVCDSAPELAKVRIEEVACTSLKMGCNIVKVVLGLQHR